MRIRSAFNVLMALALMLGATSALSVRAAPASSGASAVSSSGTSQNYLVVYTGLSIPSGAASSIAKAGGTLVYKYNGIGVVLASSSNPNFRGSLMRSPGILGVSATGAYATQLNDETQATDELATVDPGIPSSGSDNLSGLQWDMDQIHAPEARAITGGSPSITVGDIDTGLDYTHPDLAPNVDFANSVSCLTGVPNQDPAAWMDEAGHGTHTAGTIAAAKNSIGIVGVAPNVKIAGIRAGNAGGFFFPEAVICAFTWVASHPAIKVTNNSYFADPYLFNCANDPTQRAIWLAEMRAIKLAIQNGASVVAAEGNQSDDLAHPTQDVTSPDDTTPLTRDIHNDCSVIPVEVPGVVGVTANGNKLFKSYYSSYGMGSVQVIAPGGDRRFQITSAAVNGRVLSSWPAALSAGCPASLRVVDSGAVYCYLQGTSMASPHVAGVAALVVSMGITGPGAVTSRLTSTADPMDCPADMSVYANFPAVDNGAPQVCTGNIGYNSFNGHGQINALTVVSGH